MAATKKTTTKKTTKAAEAEVKKEVAEVVADTAVEAVEKKTANARKTTTAANYCVVNGEVEFKMDVYFY